MTTAKLTLLRPRLYRAGKLFAFAMALLASADLTAFLCSRYIRINRSPSLPLGFYRPVALPLTRGRLVSACLPLAVTRLGRARSYLPPGPCPGDSAPLLKYIAGLPGDVVEVTSSDVTANGVPLLLSGAIQVDSHGRSLSPVPPGRYRLHGCYWLAAPHAQSWDSRYFGCVPRKSLREVLVPWLTTSPLPPLADFRARKSLVAGTGLDDLGPGRRDRSEPQADGTRRLTLSGD
jgi:conjugative transfer signal peptidase TraF